MKIFIIAALSFLLLIALAEIAGGFIICQKTIARRTKPKKGGKFLKKSLGQARSLRKKETDDTPFEDIYLENAEGMRLHARFYKNGGSHNYAIAVHQYRSSCKWMHMPAARFYKMGINVIAPDLRGHGESDGAYAAMGWRDASDIGEFVKFILSIDPEAKIFLYGVSMGGAAVMTASGMDYMAHISCVIEDCGYSDFFEMLRARSKVLMRFRVYLLIKITSAVCKMRYGFSFEEVRPIDMVKKCKKPILFIHGDSDTLVSSHMIYDLYEAASCEKDMLVVAGAEHAASQMVAPRAYWTKVEEFLKKYFFEV